MEFADILQKLVDGAYDNISKPHPPMPKSMEKLGLLTHTLGWDEFTKQYPGPAKEWDEYQAELEKIVARNNKIRNCVSDGEFSKNAIFHCRFEACGGNPYGLLHIGKALAENHNQAQRHENQIL